MGLLLEGSRGGGGHHRRAGARDSVRYDQAMVNRIGALLAPKQAPNLTFCLDPPCG
jgi:hypothetical protein